MERLDKLEERLSEVEHAQATLLGTNGTKGIFAILQDTVLQHAVEARTSVTRTDERLDALTARLAMLEQSVAVGFEKVSTEFAKTTSSQWKVMAKVAAIAASIGLLGSKAPEGISAILAVFG